MTDIVYVQILYCRKCNVNSLKKNEKTQNIDFILISQSKNCYTYISYYNVFSSNIIPTFRLGSRRKDFLFNIQNTMTKIKITASRLPAKYKTYNTMSFFLKSFESDSDVIPRMFDIFLLNQTLVSLLGT